MPLKPSPQRTVAFFDGQNLFRSAQEAFQYHYPNYDPIALATRICQDRGWHLAQVRFYTGVPTPSQNEFWYRFWTAKLGTLGHRGVHVFSRNLRSRMKTIKLPDGKKLKVPVTEEKGIDVRIAIDVMRMAHHQAYDVALIFSQDQDLSEVADEIRVIAKEQNRWMKVASAFPKGNNTTRTPGIQKTDWIPIDRETYDACLDPRDYRPKKTVPKKP